MSVSTYQNQLERYRKEYSALSDALSKARAKLSTAQQKSKTKEAARLNTQVINLEKKVNGKIKQINETEKKLNKAKTQENNKLTKQQERQTSEITEALDELYAQETTSQITASLIEDDIVNLSDEGKAAAHKLIELLEQGIVQKELHLIYMAGFGERSVKFHDQENKVIDFPIPIGEMKELASYGVIDFLEKKNARGRTGWDVFMLPARLKAAIADRKPLDTFTIFYSWQSWSPAKNNRNLIGEALEKAVKRLRKDDAGKVYEVDRDTQGKAGSVDIAATIFEKILLCQIFVCDVTIVTPRRAKNPIPNPNVLLELGYAAATLGWENIVCVMNTAYGNEKKLPFDLRPRRLVMYNLPDDDTDRSKAKGDLIERIYQNVKSVVENYK